METDIEKVVRLLSKLISGAEVTREEVTSATWTADGELDRAVGQAWGQMVHWATDEDIRA
jgi:hypothetical protein